MRRALAFTLVVGVGLACNYGRQIVAKERSARPALIADAGHEPVEAGGDYWDAGDARAAYPAKPDLNLNVPIFVWLQDPDNAERFRDVGINVFMHLWQGPTPAQLQRLDQAGMWAVGEWTDNWQQVVNSPALLAWSQISAPDNAQEGADGGYDPCVDPEEVVAEYETIRRQESVHPVHLLLGRGAADVDWVGRGECSGQTDMYRRYADGADWLTFQTYLSDSLERLELVAQGTKNLVQWSGGKPVFAQIEASNREGMGRPTPEALRAQVWMALINGATGVGYFCHQMEPDFNETDCIDDAVTADALKTINAEVQQLAPALKSKEVVSVAVNADNDVDVVAKHAGQSTYIFVVARSVAANVDFYVESTSGTQVEVLFEGRTLPLEEGAFSDSVGAYGVHLYRY